MHKGILIILVGLFVGIFLVYAQEQEVEPISITGRLALEKQGENERLVLYDREAQSYLISGQLVGQLKNSLLELGEKNLVSVSGIKDGRSIVSCTQSYKYERDENGEKQLKMSTQCIRYYNFAVNRVLSIEQSDEELPHPQRDVAEERRLTKTTSQQQPLLSNIVGEIYGKIASVNLKSPIKTVEITNRDAASPLKEITLMISPDTRIVKHISEEEPMALDVSALKEDQEVTAVYSRSEFRAEAMFITITKE